MLHTPVWLTPMGGAHPHLQERGTVVSTDMRKDQQLLQRSEIGDKREIGDWLEQTQLMVKVHL